MKYAVIAAAFATVVFTNTASANCSARAHAQDIIDCIVAEAAAKENPPVFVYATQSKAAPTQGKSAHKQTVAQAAKPLTWQEMLYDNMDQ